MIEHYYIAIADIHGDVSILRSRLEDCDRWIALRRNLVETGSTFRYVFLGDYIDRQPFHEPVLREVSDRVDAGAVCLLGNHEDMMLGAVEGRVTTFAEANGYRTEHLADLWAANNGLRTCGEIWGNDRDGIEDYYDSIRSSWFYAFLKEHGRMTFETACVFFSHAPQREKHFSDNTLLWGNRKDYKVPFAGDFKVPANKTVSVHGHIHTSWEGVYFPRVYNYVHGGVTRTVVLADCGCGSHRFGELHPVVIRERLRSDGWERNHAGVVQVL